MGTPATILSIATGVASLRGDSKKRKQQRREAERRAQLQQIQTDQQKQNLEQQRKRRASALRARLGASGISVKSNSAKAIINGLKNKNLQELNSLSASNQLRQANLLESPSSSGSHLASVLRNLQRII